jgi:glycosyltransferase involved in cell wall biosynthesis
MMATAPDKPLLTFAIAAFNQERFIREAVEAAFAQTYSPLEIILSDDCSEDRTFEIICELAKAYRGPHRVVLNRNPLRRSIGGHINRIVEISRAEMILSAAGDDISLPERSQAVYEAWEASGRRATSIHSGIIQIDENGCPIEQVFKTDYHRTDRGLVEQTVTSLAYVQTLEPLIFGCANAFSRQLFKVFGTLPEEVIHEDNSLAFRSVLAGQVLYINQPLVKYRVHGGNVFIRTRGRSADLKSLERQEERVHRDFRNRETMYKSFMLDLQKARALGLVADAEFERTAGEAACRQVRCSLQARFLESGFFEKCRILSRLRRDGVSGAEFQSLFRRLIPSPLLLRLRLALSYAALALRCVGFPSAKSDG